MFIGAFGILSAPEAKSDPGQDDPWQTSTSLGNPTINWEAEPWSGGREDENYV